MDYSTSLTEFQIRAIGILERTTSVFSLIGCMVVISTFSFSKAFHKPINRLVFYATWGNLMTNVATLMGRSFIDDINQAGCQLQAFLIQMFMPADAFWMLAMAVNVHLTFYQKFDAQRLRKMEILYLLLCYGIPFIVALVPIFVSTPEKGRMYGDATLWCWISPNWDIFRIAVFYGPVWIVMLITFSIYIRAGREIYKKHKQLREFSFSTSHHDPEPLHGFDDPFSSTKTTEVFVTTEVVDKSGTIDLTPLGGGGRRGSQVASPQKPSKAAYSVTISSHREASNNSNNGNNGNNSNSNNNNNNDNNNNSNIEGQVQTSITADPKGAASTALNRPATNSNNKNTNKLSTITSSTGGHTGTGTGTGANPLRRRAAYEASNATWSYTKCALLFFTAMLVTWIPSSANRVYSVIHPGKALLPLEYMSASVLPLQGFWNAIIYCVTSWGACKIVWADIRSWWSRVGIGGGGGGGSGRMGRRMGGKGAGALDGHELGHRHHHHHHLPAGGAGAVGLHLPRTAGFQKMGGGKRGSKASESKFESESMTELAGSRPGSSRSPTVAGSATPPPPTEAAKMGV
ncbi:hypothetical protein MYCTH_2302067 [Thermothelomyces thermophilus ATCC 42464]|uniref:G-protein coupled receptors family 2 profile 2 domain-containing protein n=1 Tax=Thermothelomyces thermophilus (strain ATCC 42464 / BCRC 31852 / DSM 1799) TaxID=573729 RepID=G2QAY6_THET4|nr:uncharacterized protein MYCTH_2302067 [Thermothelomyces thermophilus ATCC 42464]AEO56778.1 hypothetical protein MYCTH_2302067 [Thermothelomyces thermophilus ATCC 42464]